MIMLSQTVSSVSRLSSWGTLPMRARMRAPSTFGSRSRIRNVPAVIGETHPIMRIVELFPAPLGPSMPNASPGSTWKSMPSTAVNEPNRLVSPVATTRAMEGHRTGTVVSDMTVSGDGFVTLADGSQRWGRFGAAGILVRHVDDDGEPHF